jgi:hypothetical protein
MSYSNLFFFLTAQINGEDLLGYSGQILLLQLKSIYQDHLWLAVNPIKDRSQRGRLHDDWCGLDGFEISFVLLPIVIMLAIIFLKWFVFKVVLKFKNHKHALLLLWVNNFWGFRNYSPPQASSYTWIVQFLDVLVHTNFLFLICYQWLQSRGRRQALKFEPLSLSLNQ